MFTEEGYIMMGFTVNSTNWDTKIIHCYQKMEQFGYSVQKYVQQMLMERQIV